MEHLAQLELLGFSVGHERRLDAVFVPRIHGCQHPLHVAQHRQSVFVQRLPRLVLDLDGRRLQEKARHVGDIAQGLGAVRDGRHRPLKPRLLFVAGRIPARLSDKRQRQCQRLTSRHRLEIMGVERHHLVHIQP